MRIILHSEAANLCFPIPTALVCNDLTAAFLPKFLAQYDITITKAQARKLCRAIRQHKRSHRVMTLLEVQSADGQYFAFRL